MAAFQSDLRFRSRPWALFPVFLIVLSLLTLMPWGTEARIWTVLLGFLLAVLSSLAGKGRSSLVQPAPWEKNSGPFPLGPWLFLGGVALFLRFWFAFLSRRYTEDDNLFIGMNALQFAEGWKGGLFTTFAQTPTLLPRLSAALFQFFQDPFFNLYLPPALFSCLALVGAYAAWSQALPRNLAWIMTAFLGFNYWALLPAWDNLFAAPFLAWQFWVLFLLGGYLRSSDTGQGRWAIALGFLTGLGYWTIPAWPATFLIVAVLVLADLRGRGPQGRRPLLAFSGAFSLAVLPFLWTLVQGGYGQHILKAATWGKGSGLGEKVLEAGGYLQALFWGGGSGICLPAGGGFMNPLLGSFFGLGVIELLRSRRDPRTLWMGFAALVLALPVLLADGVETFRIHSLLPLLVTVSGFGLWALARTLPARARSRVCLLAVALCGAWDLARFPGFVASWGSADRAQEGSSYARAFRVLEEKTRKEGPGLILSGMVAGEVKFSLGYFSYPFNASLNPKLGPEKARWAALYLRRYYRSHLQERFPGHQWIDLSEKDPSQEGRNALALVPLTGGERKVLMEWDKFHSFLRSVQLEVMNRHNGAPLTPVLRRIREHYPQVPRDPFLQSLFFETLLFLYSVERTYDPGNSFARWENFEAVLRGSFKAGLRNEHLLQKYGRLLAMEGDLNGARRAFQQALELRPGDPWLSAQLKELEKDLP